MSPLRRPDVCHVGGEVFGSKISLVANAGAPHMRAVNQFVGAVEGNRLLPARCQISCSMDKILMQHLINQDLFRRQHLFCWSQNLARQELFCLHALSTVDAFCQVREMRREV